jgi:hypothetical protein
MEGGNVFELNHQNFAASHGVLMNSNGGFYQHGKSYGMDTKILVATRLVYTQQPTERT